MTALLSLQRLPALSHQGWQIIDSTTPCKFLIISLPGMFTDILNKNNCRVACLDCQTTLTYIIHLFGPKLHHTTLLSQGQRNDIKQPSGLLETCIQYKFTSGAVLINDVFTWLKTIIAQRSLVHNYLPNIHTKQTHNLNIK